MGQVKDEKERKRIQKKRAREYGGDGVANLQNTGLIWTGILQCYFNVELPKPIPSHIVSIMLAGNKLSRIAQGIYKKDNYMDAITYLHIAEKGQTK